MNRVESHGRRAARLIGPRQLWVRLRTEIVKRFGLGHRVEELSSALVGRRLYFRAPALDARLVRAVKAITPQFSLRLDEASRRVWELSQNGSSWAEYEALAPLFDTMPEPARILEVGPGMGRSVVFLSQHLGWHKATFDLFEANGEARKYPLNARRSADSFCGDIGQLCRVLDFNRVKNYRVIDAADTGFRLDGLVGPYDLIYSFYGVGFHWSLADFWDEICGLLATSGVAVFTVHHSFEEFSALQDTPHCYVPFHRILAKDRPLNLLVVSSDPAALEAIIAGEAVA